MESGLPSFIPGFTCPALLRMQLTGYSDFHTQLSCSLAVRPSTFWFLVLTHVRCRLPPPVVLQPHNRNAKRLDTVLVWAFPDSLATTTGILSFPRGTLDVSVPPVPFIIDDTLSSGLPHSEILGSLPASDSPKLFAALPRPSSALNAKASTIRSFCLPCWNIVFMSQPYFVCMFGIISS